MMHRVTSSVVCAWVALFLAPPCDAHFQVANSGHAGPLFATRDSALVVGDIDRSQSTNRIATCAYPYFWATFNAPRPRYPLMVGGTVPVIERFSDTRVAVAIIGPGLPVTDIARLPQEVRRQIPSGMGAVAVPAHPDQSSCHFLEDPLSLAVKDTLYVRTNGQEDVEFATYFDWPASRCFYHEEYGGSDMWVVQDKNVDLVAAGTHYLVFWSPTDMNLGPPTTTAKFTPVFGDVGQSERFDGTAYDVGECSQPPQDFFENDCHGYSPPPGGAALPFGRCERMTGVATPNLLACDAPGAMSPQCNHLCHNHGVCIPGVVRCGHPDHGPPFDDSFGGCGETCARDACPAIQRGPAFPGCPAQCRRCMQEHAAEIPIGPGVMASSFLGLEMAPPRPNSDESPCPSRAVDDQGNAVECSDECRGVFDHSDDAGASNGGAFDWTQFL